jgi:hypothetical protein
MSKSEKSKNIPKNATNEAINCQENEHDGSNELLLKKFLRRTGAVFFVSYIENTVINSIFCKLFFPGIKNTAFY